MSMQDARIWGLTRYSGECYRERQYNSECLAGRNQHLADIAGLERKSEEIRTKIAKEEKKAKPDVQRLERMHQCLSRLENTLSNCKCR